MSISQKPNPFPVSSFLKHYDSFRFTSRRLSTVLPLVIEHYGNVCLWTCKHVKQVLVVLPLLELPWENIEILFVLIDSNVSLGASCNATNRILLSEYSEMALWQIVAHRIAARIQDGLAVGSRENELARAYTQ